MERFVTRKQVRLVKECLGRGMSERDAAAAVGVSRWMVVKIRSGEYRLRQPEGDGYHTTAADRRFAAKVAERRREFNRAWRDNEPWLAVLIAAWNPPAGVLWV